MARCAISFGVICMIKRHPETSRGAYFLMTLAAIGKLVRTKSLLIVVTGCATVCLTGMHRHRNLRHFIAFADRIVATTATNGVMFGVIKVKPDIPC